MIRPFIPLLALAALALAFLAVPLGSRADDLDQAIAPPAADPAPDSPGSQTAVLAGGCFWGQQGVFEHVKGVTKVVAGYSGGSAENASYEKVLTETTGHAEAVRITFDPRQVSFGTLLRIFFSVSHDPTQLNRQGPDTGLSYRSEIFAATPEQAQTANAYIAQLNEAKIFAAPIVTRVEPLNGFYPAEDYHQDFLARNPHYGYIVRNDLPKVAALAKVYPELYRPDPVLLADR